MKKSLLFASLLALATATASAQRATSFAIPATKAPGLLEKATATPMTQASAKAKKAAPRKVALPDNQRLVGYYNTDEVNNAFGLGSYTTSDIQPGVLLEPSDYKFYAGAKVVGVRFAVGPQTTVKGVEIFGVTSQNMSTLASKDTTFASQSATDYSSYTWNTVMLPAEQQFTLNTTDYNGLMVSYKCTQGQQTYPIAVNSDVTDRAIYCYANIPATYGGNGLAWYNVGTDGAPAIQLLLQNDNFPTDAVIATDFGKFTALISSAKKVNVTFANIGTKLNSFDYTVTVNGVTGAEQHVDASSANIPTGSYFTDSIAFNAPAETGTYDVAVNVTKVNGVANGSAITSASGTMIALSKALKRNVVVEENTGTGCGWCPRGLVGMQMLAQTYPDNFVGVGIHQYNKTDAMYNANYANLGFTGAPSCMIDRNGQVIDPYYGSNGSILEDFARRLNDLPVLSVDVNGAWNEDSTAVNATATIDPLVSGNYDIDFVLVANGLTGTTTSWKQNNYYYQYTASQVGNDPNLSQFCRGGKYGSSTFKWSFDDVLIGSSYTSTINNAKLGALVADTKATATYTINMPTSAALKKAIDKNKVYVIAIVYDNEGVANAAKVLVSSEASGIKTISNATSVSGNTVVARYNAAGQRISNEQKGLNIVRLANGKVVKYIAK